jgi:hypothetical protein
MEKITLKNVEVVFANLEDEGFGKSITIDVTDNEKAVSEWIKANNIGKKTPGIPIFKEHEGKKQYAFKLNDKTSFGAVEGLSKEDLGYGSMVTVIANAFAYDNKYGKGISSSLSAVVVLSRSKTGGDQDLAELMGGLTSEDKIDAASGYEKAKAVAKGFDKDQDTTDYSNDPISLDDIPF